MRSTLRSGSSSLLERCVPMAADVIGNIPPASALPLASALPQAFSPWSDTHVATFQRSRTLGARHWPNIPPPLPAVCPRGPPQVLDLCCIPPRTLRWVTRPVLLAESCAMLAPAARVRHNDSG